MAYKTIQQKIEDERDISEFTYESSLDWRFMKKLRSETDVRSWHIKVHLGEFNEKNKPVYVDYNLSQVWFSRLGDQLIVRPAKKSGRPIDLSSKNIILQKNGEDWLLGLEYLLKHLEGKDI